MGWHHDLVKHVSSPLAKSELNLPLFLQDCLKVLAGLGTQLDDLDGLGQLLSKEWADGDIIQQRIATLLLV